MAVQVRHAPLVAEQRLLQRDVYVHVQVVLNALEQVVLLLLEDNEDVALNHVGDLFTLLFVEDLFLVGHALDDVDGDLLGVLDDFLAFAGGAVFLVDATLAIALPARLLDLHLHESHVLNHRHLASALAGGALLLFATLSTGAFALVTVDVPVYVEFHLGAIVKLLQSHLKL